MQINCFYFDTHALCISYSVFKEATGRYSFTKRMVYSNIDLNEVQPYYRDDKTLRDTVTRIVSQLRVIEICNKIEYKNSNWDWETMKKFGRYESSLTKLTEHYDQTIDDLIMTEASNRDAVILANEHRENRFHPPKDYYLEWIKENYDLNNNTIINFDRLVNEELLDFTSHLIK